MGHPSDFLWCFTKGKIHNRRPEAEWQVGQKLPSI